MAYSFSDWQSGKKPPKGWDCADAIRDGWVKDDLDAFMRSTVRQWSPSGEKPASKPAERVSNPPEPETRQTSQTRVTEARTTQQAQPESATVTQLHTRKTVAADDSWQLELVCNEEGKLKPGVTKNWGLFLEHHPDMQGVFAFDAFKMQVMLMRKPPWDWRLNHWEPRVLQDRDYSEAVMWLESHYMTPKFSNIQQVVQAVAEHNSFDRLRDYLGGLEWDKEKRVDTWLSYYLGIDDTPYTRLVAKNWLVSSVARGLNPGCKVDTMPILEGPQGAQKSTALRVLYGDEFFTDELSDIGSKDAIMEMQGVWGLEVQEMHRFSASETNAVKKFLTRQTDRFRPPYGRSVIEAPRRVVLCGTINPEGNPYLRDPTGARRFWPLTVTKIDVDGIVADRNQIWAEAIELFKSGSKWWAQEGENEHFVAEQEKRTEVDVWVEIIAPMLTGKRSITIIDIFAGLGILNKDAGWQHASRVRRIMSKLGWISKRERTASEDRTIFYHPDFEGKKDTLGDGEW